MYDYHLSESEKAKVAEQLEMDVSAELIENIDLDDIQHQIIRDKYQENIEKLFHREAQRGEQHGAARIIFYQEMTPIQMYKNIENNTEFVFRNRVPEEGSKVIKKLKGVGGQRRIGMLIQYLGLLITVLFVLFIFHYKSIHWDDNLKLALFLVMFFSGLILFPVVGGIIRIWGRRYLIDYLDVWNLLKPPMEIRRLNNGQLAVLHYIARDKSCSSYLSAIKADDTDGKEYIPSYVDYIYIIDHVKSCTRTKNGLMIESSGRYYGTRTAYTRTTSKYHKYAVVYSAFTETQISYRKEEILAIFSDMEQLEVDLMCYGDYEAVQDGFSPLKTCE